MQPRTQTNLLILVLTVMGFVGGLVACGATKADAPEPTGSNNTPGTRIHVVQMPDGFRNVAVACDGTNEVFVTSRGAAADATPAASSVFVIPDSKRCGGNG